MDLLGLLSLILLLILSLTLQLTCQTGEKCQQTLGQLGNNVLLPLASEGTSRSVNSSMYILVTRDKFLGDSQKMKILSFHLPAESNSLFLERGYKFHLESLKLEILQSTREHEGQYFITMEENVTVQQFCLKLKLYEPVSTPEIQVLNLTQKENCSMMLNCLVHKGDQVTINWSIVPAEPSLSSVNGSQLLHLILGPKHTNHIFICNASNPISQDFQTFLPATHCFLQSGPVPWRLYLGLFFGCLPFVIIILNVVVLLLRRKGEADHYHSNQDSKNLTIYSQVQKAGSTPSKVDPMPAQDPCTTIYVAAMEPLQEPAHMTELCDSGGNSRRGEGGTCEEWK
ncbi:signaling lymphocytic activation molecule [Erinaceus europaeus]|uniref:Signaling lymphocytic activation molecule n=1 Tax=Erinaceus europaeus TaxID=9365 RepID=A0A1S3A7M9_ERIEU|nr:signaling lymphocytic activation molecule [Erinaceus europaeus]